MVEEIKKRLQKRSTFILRKPLLANSGLNAAVHDINSDIEARVEAKKAEWRKQGYTENQANMAANLAREWAFSMSNAFAPPEVRSAVLKYNLEKGFVVAEKWLKGLLASTG